MFFIIKYYIFFKGADRPLKVAGLITIIGIALSTAVLIVSLSVAGGFEDAYKRSILDFNAHIVFLKDDGGVDDYARLMDRLVETDGIVAATPFIYRESMAVHKGVMKGVVIKGVDFERLPSVSNMALKKFDSNTSTLKHLSTVLLGKALAEKLNITTPDEINLLMGADKFQKIHVGGIFETGLFDYDSQFILASIGDVQKLFRMDDRVTGIEMRLADPDDAALMTNALKEDFPPPYNLMHWGEINRPIFEAVHLEKIMFAIIVGALVLVGIFNIIGTMVLKILYKVRDIAILSALGMDARKVRRIFTFQGLMLGVTGVFVGLISGLTAARLIGDLKLIHIEPEIYFLSSLPVRIEWPVVVVVALTCIFVSWLVSYLAATRLASLNVAEGLNMNYV